MVQGHEDYAIARYTQQSMDRTIVALALNSVVLTGSWSEDSDSFSYTGALLESMTPGSTISFQFWGRALGIMYRKSSNAGKMEISVDGVSYGTVDLYDVSDIYDQVYIVSETLNESSHICTITVSALKNPSSSSYYVYLEGFIVDAAWNPTGVTLISHRSRWVYSLLYGREKQRVGQDAATPYELQAILRGKESGGTKHDVIVDSDGKLLCTVG